MRLGFVAIWLWLVLLPFGHAQDNQSAPAEAAGHEQALARAVEQEASGIIRRLTNNPGFYVLAKVKMKSPPVETLPYAPSPAGRAGPMLQRHMELVTELKLVVYLDQSFKGETEKALRDILTEKLALPDRLSGGISFKKAPLARPSEEDEKRVQQLRRDIDSLSSEKSRIERERNDFRDQSTACHRRSFRY